jgi:alkanesulfonate monooxygenase SsuD/methylene tetrahydromethanopterin reductase-like flavin-dependent oxidoreductase (luciferase family)
VAASTSTISLGTLVARVGLLPDAVLAAALSSLSIISNGRFIAGLGTGDHLSLSENEAFGLPFEPADERRARLASVATTVQRKGIPVWVGGGLPRTIELARTIGAAVNLWEADSPQVADLAASGIEVTWAGPIANTASEVATHLSELAAAGATWAVCAWPESLEVIAEAAETLGSSQ